MSGVPLDTSASVNKTQPAFTEGTKRMWEKDALHLLCPDSVLLSMTVQTFPVTVCVCDVNLQKAGQFLAVSVF